MTQSQDDEGFIVRSLLFSGPILLVISWIQPFFLILLPAALQTKGVSMLAEETEADWKRRGRLVVRKVSACETAPGNQSTFQKRRDRGNAAGTLLSSLDELARTSLFHFWDMLSSLCFAFMSH